tara:strand:+ start:5616 stop:6236 length:621 start_codon:yes stop_codon:yes gene_type:complete
MSISPKTKKNDILFKNMKVMCQTDKEFSNISSNQCSWCAAEFIKEKDNLKQLFLHKNLNKFNDMYNQCLLNGSNKRKQFNSKLYGENIDNKTLLQQYKFSVVSYFTMIGNEDPEFVKILPKDLKEEFYEKKYIMLDLDYFNSHISDGACYLASRHGQSFSIIPIFNKYLILDSHIHTTKVFTSQELTKYLFNENCGHTHVTLIKVA